MDLLVIGDDRVVSTGSDGRIVLCSLSESEEPRVFAGDQSSWPLAYEPTRNVLIAGDASGAVHVFKL